MSIPGSITSPYIVRSQTTIELIPSVARLDPNMCRVEDMTTPSQIPMPHIDRKKTTQTPSIRQRKVDPNMSRHMIRMAKQNWSKSNLKPRTTCPLACPILLWEALLEQEL